MGERTRCSVGIAATWWFKGCRCLAPVLLAVAAGSALAEDVALSMVAMAASTEGRDEVYLDKGLEQVKDAAASLTNFDTFRLIKQDTRRAAMDAETSIKITPKYTLYCTPHSKDDSGRILTSIRIEMAPKDADSKPVNVVKLSIHAVPGDTINILGPKVDDATLVLVLTVGSK